MSVAQNATRTAFASPLVDSFAAGRLALGYYSQDGFLSPVAVLTTLLIVYVALCSLLRFGREKEMRRKYGYMDRASLARMTNDDAQAIFKYIINLEFPFLYETSMQFALFKTYGIPSVSKLLMATKALVHKDHAAKRYADTTTIYGLFFMNRPTSAKTIRAIARMNSLHAPYIAKGQITNEDLLYVLSVGVTEPIRFMRLYEWRPLNDMEVCALGTFWKSIGDAMGIRYAGFLRRDAWADGIEFAEDISEWAKAYEMACMRPARTNADTAEALVNMVFWHLPRTMMGPAREIMTVLMGDRMREAFLYPEPGIFPSLLVYALLNARRFILRFLMLPRLTPVEFFSEDEKTGRMNKTTYVAEPWYNKAGLWARWGPHALAIRLAGGKVPGQEGAKYMPEGFLLEDLGPLNTKDRSLDEMRDQEARLRKERSSGCPFGA